METVFLVCFQQVPVTLQYRLTLLKFSVCKLLLM